MCVFLFNNNLCLNYLIKVFVVVAVVVVTLFNCMRLLRRIHKNAIKIGCNNKKQHNIFYGQ